MSYEPVVKKTLKVIRYFVKRPTNISAYNVGSAFSYGDITGELLYRSHSGNLTDLSLDTNTNADDTIVLPAGRYFVQCTAPVPEPAHSDNSVNNLAVVEWQNHHSSSLGGTYTAFGTKGRNNPGYKPNDSGDNAGVHSYSSGIVESTNTIYLQVRIISNTNYNVLGNGAWSSSHIIIWRAD